MTNRRKEPRSGDGGHVQPASFLSTPSASHTLVPFAPVLYLTIRDIVRLFVPPNENAGSERNSHTVAVM